MNYLLIWNIIVAFIYGCDKLLAINRKRRISEKCLLLIAYLMGGAGGMFGMVVFNHKTSKMKFRILVPLSIAFNILSVKLYYIYL